MAMKLELVSKYESFIQFKKDIIKLFLEDHGLCHIEAREASAVSSALDAIAPIHIASVKQTTMLGPQSEKPVTFFHSLEDNL